MCFTNLITDTCRQQIYHHFHHAFKLNSDVKAKKEMNCSALCQHSTFSHKLMKSVNSQ